MQEETYKVYKHNPPHLFIPNTKYFITGATYLKKGFLASKDGKTRLLNSIKRGCKKYHWTLEDWVILDNHYHLMLNAPNTANTLGKMINEVHKFTAIWLKKNLLELKEEKRIFYNYWDSCITYETSYCARLNYIYFNPVKHGYVEEASNYMWGSYTFRIKEDFDYLDMIREKYPWDKVIVKDDF